MTVLEKIRKEKHLTILEVSKAIGATQQVLSMWEKGRIPSPRYLIKLADFYKIDRYDLCQDLYRFEFSSASNLKKLRLMSGYSLREAARLLNISHQTLNCWESRKEYPTKYIIKLSEFYDVDPDHITDGKSLESLHFKSVDNIIKPNDINCIVHIPSNILKNQFVLSHMAVKENVCFFSVDELNEFKSMSNKLSSLIDMVISARKKGVH